MTLQLLISIGYVVSGVLPMIALFRRLRRNAAGNATLDAIVAQRGHPQMTLDDMGRFDGGDDIRSRARSERSDLTWDLALVGLGGVTLASVTSIASVWLL